MSKFRTNERDQLSERATPNCPPLDYADLLQGSMDRRYSSAHTSGRWRGECGTPQQLRGQWNQASWRGRALRLCSVCMVYVRTRVTISAKDDVITGSKSFGSDREFSF